MALLTPANRASNDSLKRGEPADSTQTIFPLQYYHFGLRGPHNLQPWNLDELLQFVHDCVFVCLCVPACLHAVIVYECVCEACQIIVPVTFSVRSAEGRRDLKIPDPNPGWRAVIRQTGSPISTMLNGSRGDEERREWWGNVTVL